MKDRVRLLNDAPVRPQASYVLYWAQMNRRTIANHALAHAITLANDLKLPVLYYEGLTCTYPYANDRLHTFVLEGVGDTASRLSKLGIGYLFYLRRRRSDPDNVLYRLAANAALVVTDDYPTFIAAAHNASVPAKLDVPFHAVDSSCIVPMASFDRREYAAYTIRPKIHRALPRYLVPLEMPKPRRAWDAPIPEFHTPIDDVPAAVASCEIDHSVPPSISHRGGMKRAEKRLAHFLKNNLRRYAKERNEPAAHATSNLSAYLHFGQISSLHVALAAKEYAKEHKLIADEFLEELIVRRELAFNHAFHSPDPGSLTTLPAWARETLDRHAKDSRPALYTREQLERGETYDSLWNATQKELVLRGSIHGYYRMYWGKKILEWTRTPQDAVDLMVYLHDRFSLDGRDPNTYTNILWCLGLHDRPWNERPVFGMVRYMSLDGMKRKTHVDQYLKEIRYIETAGKDPFLSV
jgi:deoxyribodipyrimidine photo-lyase